MSEDRVFGPEIFDFQDVYILLRVLLLNLISKDLMKLKARGRTSALHLFPIALLFLTGCATSQSHHAAFPRPALMLHQPDQILNPRLKDAKSFAQFVRQIQSECDSYYSKTKPRNPQTVDVVVVIKPGKRSRFWLVHNPPQDDTALDKPLLQKLQRIAAPPVEQGPVSFSMRLLLWGAIEPDPREVRPLLLPTEWRDTIGTNQNVLIPDGIMSKIWPD